MACEDQPVTEGITEAVSGPLINMDTTTIDFHEESQGWAYGLIIVVAVVVVLLILACYCRKRYRIVTIAEARERVQTGQHTFWDVLYHLCNRGNTTARAMETEPATDSHVMQVSALDLNPDLIENTLQLYTISKFTMCMHSFGYYLFLDTRD